jgi:prepilin-type N-terminal cleavage/methylation domain-containing protein
MTIKNRLRSNQAGFTLIELMIATTIFTVLLVIIIFAFLFVSNDYVKSNVEAQTQETARAVIEQVAEDIQLNNFNVSPIITSGNYHMYCIGNDRYSFWYNKEIAGSGSDGAPHALVIDTGCTSSSVPETLNDATITGNELLGNHMRLGNFSVTNTGVAGQYAVSVTIAYGSDNQGQGGPLIPTANTSTNPTSYTYTCPDNNLGGNFCASTTLSTIVQQRVQE